MKKVYVKVLTRFNPGEPIKPMIVYWHDGREFEIDKILDISKGASLAVGGVGIKYTVVIQGKTVPMYLEDGKWFMEGK